MRQIHQRLDRALDQRLADFVQQQRENVRDDQIRDDLQYGDEQRVSDHALAVLTEKDLLEVGEADPFRSGNAEPRFEILKRHHNPADGDIAENDRQDDSRQQQQMKRPSGFQFQLLDQQTARSLRVRCSGGFPRCINSLKL